MAWKRKEYDKCEEELELMRNLDKGKNYRRVLSLARPYRWLLVQALICMLLMSGVGLVSPIVTTRLLLDKAFPDRDPSILLIALAAMFLISLFSQVIGYLQGYVLRFVSHRVILDLRRKLFRHLQHLSMSFYDEQRSGKILARLMSDVTAIQTLVTGQALQLISQIVTFIVLLILMICMFPWQLTLIGFATIPFHVGTFLVFKERVKDANRRVRIKMAAIYGSTSEVLSGTKLVKTFTAEGRENQAFVQELRDLFQLSFWSSQLSTWWQVVASFFQNIGRIVVYAFAGMAVIHGQLSLGFYIVFINYVGRLYQPIISLIQFANRVIPALVGVERVYQILETEPEIKDSDKPIDVENIEGEIEFRNVCFTYKEGEEVLHDVSFQVNPGEVVAFVGPSGSGKTTMANLIARFYDATSGEILVDGHDIRNIRLKTYREQMGAVLQESFMFSGSIAENIKYGSPEATDEEMHQAAKLANAYDFVMEFPEGFASEIGERGVRLSGGQKQRISIARAILRNPKILILDEATSSLDTASELLIQEALDRLMSGRTTFIIAHRLSTIKEADKIVVMKEGRVEQIGTHDELLEQEGLYRELYEPQLARERDEARFDSIRKQVA
ncbi:MAG: ABC transporter ATP-binding protein [Planctomycetes bacterium]|nr:ABC transporter ATP-binding protein [Planctomycetota bacterium]